MNNKTKQDSIWIKLLKLLVIVWGCNKIQSIDESLESLRNSAQAAKKSPPEKPSRNAIHRAGKAKTVHFPFFPAIILVALYVISLHYNVTILFWISLILLVLLALFTLADFVRLIIQQNQNNYEVYLVVLKNEKSGHDTLFNLGYYHRKAIETISDSDPEALFETKKILRADITDEEKLAFWCGHAFYYGQSDEIKEKPIGLSGNWPDQDKVVFNWYLRGRRAIYDN